MRNVPSQVRPRVMRHKPARGAAQSGGSPTALANTLMPRTIAIEIALSPSLSREKLENGADL